MTDAAVIVAGRDADGRLAGLWAVAPWRLRSRGIVPGPVSAAALAAVGVDVATTAASVFEVVGPEPRVLAAAPTLAPGIDREAEA